MRPPPGQDTAVRFVRLVPQAGPAQRPVAVDIGFPYRHADRHQGRFAAHREPFHQVGIVGQARPAIEAQGLLESRDHEDRGDFRVFQNVAERIEPVVAGPVGNQDRPVVGDMDEARPVAARRDIAGPAVGPGRPDHQKGGVGDEGPAMGVEPVDGLPARPFPRRVIARTQGVEAVDGGHGQGSSAVAPISGAAAVSGKLIMAAYSPRDARRCKAHIARPRKRTE